MTRSGANNLLQNLRTYYPRSFLFKTEADVVAKVTDYETSLSKWDDETGLKAAHNWHLEHSEAPTVADLIRECKLVEMEKQPYIPPKQEPVTMSDNPWKKALDSAIKDKRKNPNTKHEMLYWILMEYGYEEYKKAKVIWLNCKNRRNEENRRLGLDEVDNRATSAQFDSKEEEEQVRQMIRDGKL